MLFALCSLLFVLGWARSPRAPKFRELARCCGHDTAVGGGTLANRRRQARGAKERGRALRGENVSPTFLSLDFVVFLLFFSILGYVCVVLVASGNAGISWTAVRRA